MTTWRPVNSFNPFGTGRGLSTKVEGLPTDKFTFQSLWNRARSFDTKTVDKTFQFWAFQSLWSRAGFFDDIPEVNPEVNLDFNPFEAGRGFLTLASAPSTKRGISLNPFGTGQGLSTYSLATTPASTNVSIPLEQGEVFRHEININIPYSRLFQSLWNRTGSFDWFGALVDKA